MNADAKLTVAVIKLFLDNFEVLATHPSQYGKTEVLEMKIRSSARSNPVQIPNETAESRPEGEFTELDRQVVRTRSY